MASEIEFDYIGWCKGTGANNVEHDKVWTGFHINDTYYAAWGKRGKALSFKKHESAQSLNKVIKQKKRKYDEVDAFRLFAIFPYFEDDVSKGLTVKILTNGVK